MTIEGTVINGVIVLDGSPQLPEGKRVIVDLEGDDYEPPPSTASSYSTAAHNSPRESV